MSRSSLLIAASAIVLAACQPAADAPQDIVAEAPPVESAETAVEETVAEVEETVAETVETAMAEPEAAIEDVAADATPVEAPIMDADDESDHSHSDDEHSHDEDHSHDEAHDHDDDHDHSHDEDAHDHADGEDHDHAGGEAHVHGLSELAASLEGETLSVSIEGAMANFDLDETLRTLDDTTPYSTGTVDIVGGDCTMSASDVSIRPISTHGNLIVDLTYTCAAPGSIEAINVTGFESFAGFEQVNAVFLTETGQVAETLTESDTRLDLS
ncbi:MAG: DUF2796 domain-containing protein [Pseudomonadota bacterium]